MQISNTSNSILSSKWCHEGYRGKELRGSSRNQIGGRSRSKEIIAGKERGILAGNSVATSSYNLGNPPRRYSCASARCYTSSTQSRDALRVQPWLRGRGTLLALGISLPSPLCHRLFPPLHRISPPSPTPPRLHSSLPLWTNGYNYVHVPIHNPHRPASSSATPPTTEQSAPPRIVRLPAMLASDNTPTTFNPATSIPTPPFCLPLSFFGRHTMRGKFLR